MKLQIGSLFFILILLGTVGWANQRGADSANRTVARSSAGGSHPPADEGEKIFSTNCARCHMPPMSLPPRITGTVIMHMRERARLSRHDEELLLRYLAP
jgi:hypothetical protein